MSEAQPRGLIRTLLVLSLCIFLCSTQALHAQGVRRTRRESNANRKARIARTVQDTYTHRWEVGGGPGYIRFRSGQFQKRDSQIAFWASSMYTLTPRLGVVAIATGGFGSARIGNTVQNAVDPQIQDYAFMAGPSYRLVAREKYAVSAYATGGASYGRFSTGPHDYLPQVVGIWPSGYAAAFSAGANFDYNLYPNLALRVSPNYLGTTFGNTLQSNKAINFGVIYRFGRVR